MNTTLVQIVLPILILIISVLGIVIFGPYVLALKRWAFTFLPEGQILTVMNGQTRSEHIARIQGWKVVDGRIIKSTDNEKHSGRLRDFHHDLFGVYFYGLPPFRQLWERQFSWNKWASRDGDSSTEQLLVPRSGLVTSTYFRFPYGYRFTGLETSARTSDPNDPNQKKGGRSGLTIRVSMELLIEVQAYDVDHMLFPDLTWFTELIAFIEQILRSEVGRLTYEEIIEQRNHDDSEGLTRIVMRLLCGGEIEHDGDKYDPLQLVETDFSGLSDETANFIITQMPSVQQIGVIVRKIDLRNVGVDGTPEEVAKILETINAPAVAEKQAEAGLIKARAEGESTRVVGAAKAEVIERIGKAEAESIQARTAAYGTGRIGIVVAQGDGNARALEKVPCLTHLVTGTDGVGVILGDSSGSGRTKGDNVEPEEPKGSAAPPTPAKPAGPNRSWGDRRKNRRPRS